MESPEVRPHQAGPPPRSAPDADQAQESDGELIERACRGEAEAFGVLVTRYEGPLFNFLLRFSGNRATAQDLCQDTFLKAFRGLPGFRVGAPFKPWLYRVAINTARSLGRRASRRETGMDNLPEPVEAHGSTHAAGPQRADAAMTQAQDGVAVQLALAQLPEQYREAVVLKFVEDFSYEEMADVLGARVPALKMRVHRGLGRLRELLEQSGDKR